MRAFVLLLVACGDADGVGDDDRDRDGFDDADDCEPDLHDVHPGTWEECDGIDNDCDGEVDELYDLDADGWLADEPGCRALGDAVDCDDLDASIHPDATEMENRRDDDCDGVIDDSPDADGDGYEAFADCDDGDAFTNPAAPDACDGLDNDCDGAADEDFDMDGDGVAPCVGDCDDADPFNSPGLPEACDGSDNDCDGEADEDFDQDGDGARTCDGDCADDDPAIGPAAIEVCDGIDNDCDPDTDEVGDRDGDGTTQCDGDCDDGDDRAVPGGTESCDGADNDCDGWTDNATECWGCTSLATGHEYCATRVSWDDAAAACEGLGMTLAVFADTEENDEVSADAYDVGRSEAWIGLTDVAKEATWSWMDGSVTSFTRWQSGQPDDAGAGEDCAETNFGFIGGWNDAPCHYTYPFLCGP